MGCEYKRADIEVAVVTGLIQAEPRSADSARNYAISGKTRIYFSFFSCSGNVHGNWNGNLLRYFNEI